MSERWPKPRSDAWDAALTEAQRWQAYARFRRHAWYEVSAWVAEQFGVRKPGRNALYHWAKKMRKLESAHRIEQAVQARTEIGALAGTAATNDKLIEAYKSMAAELALAGDAKEAVRLTQMAMSLAAQQTAQMELELKAQRLEQQQDTLKLAREKFEAAEKRIAATQEALQKLGESGGLSAEARETIERAMGIL